MVERSGYLEGKVALVTGAANATGIGFATVRALAAAGAKVVVADIAEEPLADSERQLVGEGYDVVPYVVDVSQEGSVTALIAFLRDRFGRLDILDNNAASQGHSEDGIITAMPVDLWDRVMAVNARGTMLMCKHAVPLMVDSGGGSIVNISSGTAQAGDFYATAYAASKGAINTFTKYVATQFGAQGIRCNALSLGLILTGALEAGMPPPMQDLFRQHNLNRTLGRPEDIAEMVAFLASDRSRFITGQVLPVDGGIFAHVPTTVEMARMMLALGSGKP